jgi:F-type H+-transporting ATPase subunit b
VQLDWSTFVLELVNFLILVWILKHFLYKPVLAAIGQRRAVIEKKLSDAEARKADAQTLETQYQNRLADWDREKEKLRANVMEEIKAQRERMMAALHESLAQEREKTRVLEERRLKQIESSARQEALRAGIQLTSRLLTRIASPELEAIVVGLVSEDLPLLPEEQLTAIHAGWETRARAVNVTSAFPLADAQRNLLIEQLRRVAGEGVSIEFTEDRNLLAGLRISIGPWVLHANLQDELGFFAEMVSNGQKQ